ncbi:hypothetical protein F2P79_021925 [Pimephales promelas]|nr:hypothetical protein F2P79_021925 [Pimephales promelas]
MHHHPQNRERAINLSILSVSGPVSALQPYSPRNPKTRGFPHAARRVMGITPPDRGSASFTVGTTTNFTSSGAIRMPPAVPLNHGPGKRFGPRGPDTQLRASGGRREAGVRDRRWLASRRTAGPLPRSNYELFNCSNFSIRYWSWNYRGCWHQTCPPMGPRPWAPNVPSKVDRADIRMSRRRRGGRAIGPRLSRVTKAAGAAGAAPGWVLDLINARVPDPRGEPASALVCMY